jgi:hypothetical protein
MVRFVEKKTKKKQCANLHVRLANQRNAHTITNYWRGEHIGTENNKLECDTWSFSFLVYQTKDSSFYRWLAWVAWVACLGRQVC